MDAPNKDLNPNQNQNSNGKRPAIRRNLQASPIKDISSQPNPRRRAVAPNAPVGEKAAGNPRRSRPLPASVNAAQGSMAPKRGFSKASGNVNRAKVSSNKRRPARRRTAEEKSGKAFSFAAIPLKERRKIARILLAFVFILATLLIIAKLGKSKSRALANVTTSENSQTDKSESSAVAPDDGLPKAGVSLKNIKENEFLTEIVSDPELDQKEAQSLVESIDKDDAPMIMTADVDGNQISPNLQPRIQAAKKFNEDTKGWFRINGTNMNFAVVQNTKNVNYYTSLGYNKLSSKYYNSGKNKKYQNYGVLWLAPGNDANSRETLSDNTIIFGHNWDNIWNPPRKYSETDIMLEQIAGYHYTDFAKENPLINFSIEGEDLNWVVVSAFYTEDLWSQKGLNFDYVDSDFTDAQKQTFIDEITVRSQFKTDDDTNINDKFLTISTCTRVKGSTDRQRFVVVARLVREDEEEMPELEYTENESPKAPKL